MAALAQSITNAATSAARVGLHYARVGAEFGRLVGAGAKVTLPSPGQLAEAQVGYGKFIATFQNGAWKKVTVREAGQVFGAGVTVYGFFLVGEMIGRGNLVGYKIPGVWDGGKYEDFNDAAGFELGDL
ncbi:hypothetical protein CcCBS67573_g01053 [Chytriomyces confervae]|uniref:Uncharacterized protein n=1 Tax=Chytriomyces confervae TaxID=246404 RepID=A0A507FQS4_9FUNG|nr:hypothetical protein HDU80_011456 [Chytriomyces hyalinus]TPX77666.1 hypothetical protein CcCBS67573_g01053 [Chytriomyces confervae]